MISDGAKQEHQCVFIPKYAKHPIESQKYAHLIAARGACVAQLIRKLESTKITQPQYDEMMHDYRTIMARIKAMDNEADEFLKR